MNIKQELMTVRRIEYDVLEEHIRQVYGFENREFSVIAMEEWNNDSDHLFRMKKKPLNRWDQEALAKWKANTLRSYMLRRILQDMVNNGDLEEGDYLITVCW